MKQLLCGLAVLAMVSMSGVFPVSAANNPGEEVQQGLRQALPTQYVPGNPGFNTPKAPDDNANPPAAPEIIDERGLPPSGHTHQDGRPCCAEKACCGTPEKHVACCNSQSGSHECCAAHGCKHHDGAKGCPHHQPGKPCPHHKSGQACPHHKGDKACAHHYEKGSAKDKASAGKSSAKDKASATEDCEHAAKAGGMAKPCPRPGKR